MFPSLDKDQAVLALSSWWMPPPFPNVPVDFNIASGRGTGLVQGRDTVRVFQVKVLVGKDHDHVEYPCDHGDASCGRDVARLRMREHEAIERCHQSSQASSRNMPAPCDRRPSHADWGGRCIYIGPQPSTFEYL